MVLYFYWSVSISNLIDDKSRRQELLVEQQLQTFFNENEARKRNKGSKEEKRSDAMVTRKEYIMMF